MSRDMFQDLANGREIAEVQQDTTDNQIPFEVLEDHAFRATLDYLDQESEEKIQAQLELEQKKSDILGVVNAAFLKEAFNHINKTMDTSNIFKLGAQDLTAEQWLAYYQNTNYIHTTPVWILGEKPRLSRGGPMVFEYIVGVSDPDKTYIDLKLATMEHFIEPIDPIPLREELESAFNPRTQSFAVARPNSNKIPKGAAALDIHSINSVSDEDMKSFQITTGLMDLLADFNALDNSDDLIENYRTARNWSAKLAGAEAKRQRGFIYTRSSIPEQKIYANRLAVHLDIEREEEPFRNPWY